MADVRPFRGFRFDPKRVPLSRVLCPPYDVIDKEMAAKLRRGKLNAVHLELPEGEGAAKYRSSADLWKRWRRAGVVVQDDKPCLYVCEERFTVSGKPRRRLGFLAALGVTPAGAKSITPHEHTLPKPKADRLKLLSAVKANVSPIFGIFPDGGGAVRKVLAKTIKSRPDASGVSPGGVRYRLWALSDSRAVLTVCRRLASQRILIADGHHRCEVSRAYYARHPRPEAETVLAYLCPEEDAGLVMLPTHRVVQDAVGPRVRPSCALKTCRSQAELLKRLERSSNPYAFGVYEDGFEIASPKAADGCKSGLGVEWLARHLFKDLAPDRIGYTPDADKAVRMARKLGGAAVFVKRAPVSQVRRAVAAVGLLPPKSTYFFPKIATGLVFKSLER
ncbi:MAG: DUF1015 domain-containing protein [Elusimicrobia bacterium]|nr:DUF1015 domain-containing protein [Elusimicrobiota bacterium]